MSSGPCRGMLDFDATARRILKLTDLKLIREQLMLVWNARGAVDIAKIDSELMQMMGPVRAAPKLRIWIERCAGWTDHDATTERPRGSRKTAHPE
jgi:hypothetical protein